MPVTKKPITNLFNQLCVKITLLIPKKNLTLRNAVYFRFYINLIHITPPDKAEGYDGSHHPRYAEYNPVSTLSSIYTHFNKLKEKSYRKTLWEKVKLLKMSNFTFFHNVFYAICILKSFNSHMSDVVCSFFEFGTASKWCIREWVNNWRRKRGST